MRCTPPSNMTAAERMDEIATILARGYQRHIARESKAIRDQEVSQDLLDVTAGSEASCESRASNAETPTSKS